MTIFVCRVQKLTNLPKKYRLFCYSLLDTEKSNDYYITWAIQYNCFVNNMCIFILLPLKGQYQILDFIMDFMKLNQYYNKDHIQFLNF
jgi:hypothetical protein